MPLAVRRLIAITTIAAASGCGLAVTQPGLDYFNDSMAIDALARGDLRAFFANQPLMGPLSLLVRAPFVRAVFHQDLTTVYFAGFLPCLMALVVLAWHLRARMASAGRSVADQRVVLLLCLGSLPLIRAVHWGHPEDVLATAMVIGALLAADGSRPVLAGLLLGGAVASKQWAVLAAGPALLLLVTGRRPFLLAAAGAVALLMVPMLLGNPERFWLVQHAASSVDPMYVMGNHSRAPGAHVNPFSVWLPFASEHAYEGRRLLFMPDTLPRLAHPLILGLGFALPALLWRHKGAVGLVEALQLLALIVLMRCALDPMSLEYYHLPIVVALAAAAAVGGRRELDAAVFVTAGLSIAFLHTAVGVDELERYAWLKFAAYMLAVVPSTVWLGYELFGAPRLAYRASRSPRAHAASSSA